MRKLFLVGMASAFAVAAFGFSPTKHTNVLTRAGVTYVQRGALGSADYVATNVAMSAADVNALPNNETQLLSNAAFTNAVRAIGGGGGGGGGNILHCNGGGTGGQATYFTEGTAKIIEYVNAGKPIFCQYGGNIWAYLANITPTEIGAGITGYYLTFICSNPSAYANGVATPMIISCILVPSLNYHEVHVATYRLLEDNLSMLTNSVNFKSAVATVGAVPNNALVLSDNVVKTVGGTNALPKEINAVSAGEFARPWKQYNGYQRLDTVSYGGKIWVCAENHSGEEVFNEDGHWMDLVSNSVTDKSWVRWHRKWVDDNYAPRGGDVSFGSVQASSVSVGYQGTGTVSANLSGGATIGSGKTLAVNNGATFTIGGSNFNTVVGNAIDAKVLAATNAVVDQVHRITATNGMSAIDGDLGIYDANGHEYDAQNVQGLHYFLNYDANGSPYWTANYKGASWDYHFFIRFVGDGIWHTVCQELDIDRTESAGGLNDNTLYFRAPLGVLYKSAVRNPIRHGSVVPNYVKVAGKQLTNDVSLGVLTIQGQTYDGTSDITIAVEGMSSDAVVLTNGTAKTKGGTVVQASAVGAISTNTLNSGMTWKSGSSSWMNGTLAIGNTGTLQVNNTAKTWFINPLNVKVGTALTYSEADDLKTWIGRNAAIPFSQRYDGALQLRRYQVSPSSHGIGAYQFVGGKFYAKNWTDYMLYDDSGDIIQTTSLPWYLEHTYVPNTRKINGQALSNDITIATMDYQAMTNTVNAVKEQFYDQPLQVNWTMRMVNGEMKLYATTNVNMSVLQ